MKIEITWEVEDGYCGGSRPQHTMFNTGDYMSDEDWNDISEDEKTRLIEERVSEDFNEKIYYVIRNQKIKS